MLRSNCTGIAPKSRFLVGVLAAAVAMSVAMSTAGNGQSINELIRQQRYDEAVRAIEPNLQAPDPGVRERAIRDMIRALTYRPAQLLAFLREWADRGAPFAKLALADRIKGSEPGEAMQLLQDVVRDGTGDTREAAKRVLTDLQREQEESAGPPLPLARTGPLADRERQKRSLREFETYSAAVRERASSASKAEDLLAILRAHAGFVRFVSDPAFRGLAYPDNVADELAALRRSFEAACRARAPSPAAEPGTALSPRTLAPAAAQASLRDERTGLDPSLLATRDFTRAWRDTWRRATEIQNENRGFSYSFPRNEYTDLSYGLLRTVLSLQCDTQPTPRAVLEDVFYRRTPFGNPRLEAPPVARIEDLTLFNHAEAQLLRGEAALTLRRSTDQKVRDWLIDGLRWVTLAAANGSPEAHRRLDAALPGLSSGQKEYLLDSVIDVVLARSLRRETFERDIRERRERFAAWVPTLRITAVETHPQAALLRDASEDMRAAYSFFDQITEWREVARRLAPGLRDDQSFRQAAAEGRASCHTQIDANASDARRRELLVPAWAACAKAVREFTARYGDRLHPTGN